MSKSGISLDLSEYFNTDDSNGHRLAELLQKRRGGVQCQKFLFVESEPLRLSVDVQLERVPEQNKNQNDKIDLSEKDGENIKEPENETKGPTEDKISPDKTKTSESDRPVQAENNLKPNDIDANRYSKGIRPLSPAKPFSPRLAAIRGGVSPADRLRRYSLKRLTKICTGRRTLLREFEDTMTDSAFSPPVFSTPLSQPSSESPPPLPAANEENVVPNATQHENASKKSPNDATISWSVSAHNETQNKNIDLRQMMESIVETTLKRVQSKNKEDEESEKKTEKEPKRNSTLRRTYTVEKGDKPGQVILTPEVINSPKSVVMDISSFLEKTPAKTVATSPVSPVENAAKKRQSFAHISPIGHGCSNALENMGNITPTCRKRILETQIQCDDMDISPQLNQSIRNAPVVRSKTIINATNMIRSPHATRNGSQLTISFDSPNAAHCSPNKTVESYEKSHRIKRCSVMLKSMRGIDDPRSPKTNVEICMTPPPSSPLRSTQPPQNDVIVNNITADEDELVIPETQEQTLQGANSIVIDSQSYQAPIVVIPVTQTFNSPQIIAKSHPNERENFNVAARKTNAVEESLHSSHNAGRQKSHNHEIQIQNTPERQTSYNHETEIQNISKIFPKYTEVEENIEQANAPVDNLKLTDIITDDEDEPITTSVTESVLVNSQIPLNLAGSNDQNKHLRKRSVSRRHIPDIEKRHNNNSTNFESEPLPLALSTRRSHRKKSLKRQQMPLNKAPGAPLNGEEFAKELERMSNYEILDLRKRNSLGRIFAISGRKSVWKAEEAIEKQMKLDSEIEMELLKRNMQIAENDTVENVDELPLVDITNKPNDIESQQSFPLAPQDFCDSTNLENKLLTTGRESSLVDDRSVDRISFRTRLDSLRSRKKKSVPEVLENYLKVSQEFTSRKKKKRSLANQSKRSLYTQRYSESDDSVCNISNEKNHENSISTHSLPCVPSPPRSETDQMPALRVVSPPPPLSRSLENSLRKELNETANRTATRISRGLIPPPPNFETDSGVETNGSSRGHHSPTENSSNDYVFKKPLPPQPAKRKKLTRQKAVESLESIVLNNVSSATSETSVDISEGGTLRRSKRGHIPVKENLFQSMLQKSITTSLEKKKAIYEKKKHATSKANKESKKQINGSKENVKNSSTRHHPNRKPLSSVSEETETSEPAAEINKKNEKKSAKATRRKTKKIENIEHSRIALHTPPPLVHFNNVFDQLRNLSHSEETATENIQKHYEIATSSVKVKNLRVRVARLENIDAKQMIKSTSSSKTKTSSKQHKKTAEEVGDCVSTVSSTNDTKQSNFELISWLKNITDAENTAKTDAIFKEMRISSASNLSFTELQGVEYAFYDTDDQASLGYLRFKPRQIKPRKRAKRYHLHFVTLVGNFRITANDKERLVGPGDMVAIEKSVYYDIENMSDDIGILMVIKK